MFQVSRRTINVSKYHFLDIVQSDVSHTDSSSAASAEFAEYDQGESLIFHSPSNAETNHSLSHLMLIDNMITQVRDKNKVLYPVYSGSFKLSSHRYSVIQHAHDRSIDLRILRKSRNMD